MSEEKHACCSVKAPPAPVSTASCCGDNSASPSAHAHDRHDHGMHHDHLNHAMKDPVCGMSVDPANARHQTEHGGAT